MQISLLNVIFGRCTAETLVTLNGSNPYTNKDETILQTKPVISFLNRSSGKKPKKKAESRIIKGKREIN